MYRYDEFDTKFVNERVEQFRDQVGRRLRGELSEEKFKPLRLQNGVYLQLHAYMLRVAIPYGQLNSRQMRMLARIARDYDRGYGHFTTRQNIQYNWIALKDLPDVLALLADVEMHAIQTSGNCIRNVTSDHFAGATKDEICDPRPWCEIIRQWSTLHPEFGFLPRKFKIAVTAASHDRAAIKVHDIGLQIVQRDSEIGFKVYVGGGQGRTPRVAVEVSSFVSEANILDYLEAIMRVYNRFGRRDNKYKARIKILVEALGGEKFREQVEAEYASQTPSEKIALPREEIDRIHRYFAMPDLPPRKVASLTEEMVVSAGEEFANWAKANLHPHKVHGYTSVSISLKPQNVAPGDATDTQMEVMADIAERYGFDDIRVTHAQNIVLAHIAIEDTPKVYSELKKHNLATPNEGQITDMIVCPGLDYCNLANARSIPLSQEIYAEFSDPADAQDIGRLHVNISGCINACGHHHVGHIGILGVDRNGQEFYQITFGGRADEKAGIGQIAGPAIESAKVPKALRRVIETYRSHRSASDEKFIDVLERVGQDPFKEAVYADV